MKEFHRRDFANRTGLAQAWTVKSADRLFTHYGRLEMPFEALCQHLVQNQFTSDAFQGDSESHLFQWNTNIWETWPVIEGHNFKEDWDKEGHINHPKRSETALTTDDIHQLQQDTRAHNELRAPMNQFMERQFANQEPLRHNLLIPTLEVRINKAAKLRGDFAQMVHTISRNFTIRDTNQIMEQLILRCQGDLNVYIQNEMLMTIVWKLWAPWALKCLTQCCQLRTRRLRLFLRTYWVKAQLSSCRCHCSSPGAAPSPPTPGLKKKKKGFFGLEGVLLGCSLAGLVVCGFASVAWLGILPKVACHGDDGRGLLAQVALDFPHCVKAQLDLSTPEDRIDYTRALLHCNGN